MATRAAGAALCSGLNWERDSENSQWCDWCRRKAGGNNRCSGCQRRKAILAQRQGDIATAAGAGGQREQQRCKAP